jgi:hypothetical protein
MISSTLTITPELAIAAGKLAAEHPNASVTIAYDDERAEQLWLVMLDAGYGQMTYVVNDENGSTYPAGLGDSRLVKEATGAHSPECRGIGAGGTTRDLSRCARCLADQRRDELQAVTS